MKQFKQKEYSTPPLIKTLKLSKKLKNKLIEIFKPICNQQRINEILNSVISNYDIYQQAKINIVLPEILSSILSKNNGIINIELNDLSQAINIFSQKIVNKESFEDVVLSIGMGGSIDTPNIRTPSYIISAIKTLESLKRISNEEKISKKLPIVRVFKADNLSAELNGFDLIKVKKTTKITFDFLKAFLDKFFPKIKKQFIFETDTPTTNNLFKTLEDQSKILLTTEAISEEVSNILKMGEKHGGNLGKRNALIYATAHPFYNNSITPHNTQSPQLIIDYGGKPQARFNQISRTVIDNNRNNNYYKTCPIIHTIIKSGKIPVYYTARDGDLSLLSDFNEIIFKEVDRATHVDYKEIFSVVKKEEFENFVKNFKILHKQQLNEL